MFFLNVCPCFWIDPSQQAWPAHLQHSRLSVFTLGYSSCFSPPPLGNMCKPLLGNVDSSQTPPRQTLSKHIPHCASPLEMTLALWYGSPFHGQCYLPSPCGQELCGQHHFGLNVYCPSPSLAGSLPPELPRLSCWPSLSPSSATDEWGGGRIHSPCSFSHRIPQLIF